MPSTSRLHSFSDVWIKYLASFAASERQPPINTSCREQDLNYLRISSLWELRERRMMIRYCVVVCVVEERMLTLGAANTITNKDARAKTTFGICIFRSMQPMLDKKISSGLGCLGGTLV